jgi:hypothetical protein
MRTEIAASKLYSTELLPQRSQYHRMVATHAGEVPSQSRTLMFSFPALPPARRLTAGAGSERS